MVLPERQVGAPPPRRTCRRQVRTAAGCSHLGPTSTHTQRAWAAACQGLEAPTSLRHFFPTLFVMETNVGLELVTLAAEPVWAGPAPRSRQQGRMGLPRKHRPLVATCEYDAPGNAGPRDWGCSPLDRDCPQKGTCRRAGRWIPTGSDSLGSV